MTTEEPYTLVYQSDSDGQRQRRLESAKQVKKKLDDKDMTGAENFREQLRDYLEVQADKGTRYVTAKKLAAELDTNSSRVGTNLGLLAEDGVVEQWSRGSTGATWEITIDQ